VLLYECELVNNHSLTHSLTKLIFLHPTTLLDTLFDFLPTSDITHQFKNTDATSSLDMKTQGLSNYHHSLILLYLYLAHHQPLFEHSNRQELSSHRHHHIIFDCLRFEIYRYDSFDWSCMKLYLGLTMPHSHQRHHGLHCVVTSSRVMSDVST
jgi:hypothetical protein